MHRMLSAMIVLCCAGSALADDDGFVFDARLAMGVARHAQELGFATEGAAMGRIPWVTKGPGHLTFMAEVGGGALSTETSGASYGHAGVGLGYQVGPAIFGVVPSLVAGSIHEPGIEGPATGFRITAVAELTAILGIQVTRQVLDFGPTIRDQTIATASLNLVPLLLLVALAGN